MYRTPEGKDIFVVDGHTHFWDGSPENQKNIHGKQFIDCFYDYHRNLGPEEYLWSVAVARLLLPPEIHLQAPPNLSDDFGVLLEAGIDYLVCEALAELTLAILQKDRQRDESLGYTRDLPLYLQAAMPFVLDGRTKFISNAGGINPVAAGRAVVGAARSLGVSGIKIATVVGDDVRGRAAELGLPDGALFASAYLGARPIVEASSGIVRVRLFSGDCPNPGISNAITRNCRLN